MPVHINKAGNITKKNRIPQQSEIILLEKELSFK
jgi:hypothetical protein